MRVSRRNVLGLFVGGGAASLVLHQLGLNFLTPFESQEQEGLWLEFNGNRHEVVSIERQGIWFDVGEDKGEPQMALYRCNPNFVAPQNGILRV